MRVLPVSWIQTSFKLWWLLA